MVCTAVALWLVYIMAAQLLVICSDQDTQTAVKTAESAHLTYIALKECRMN